jgi:GAF domain
MCVFTSADNQPANCMHVGRRHLVNGTSLQELVLQAVLDSGLDTRTLWIRYYGVGGSLAELEVDAYLAGLQELPPFEQDNLIDALHELLGPAAAAVPAPVRSADNDPRPGGEALWALGAAGASFLTPEEAELERLKAVTATRLLDTPPDARFDRITKRAQEYFAVSSATVALIDNRRQFLKSVIGPVGQNMPRELSFCNTTIRSAGPLVIPDASTDERFRRNPLVVGEPLIRFYAGYPLRGLRGWVVGTLCVIDQNPRSFSASDEQMLRELAKAAQDELLTVAAH